MESFEIPKSFFQKLKDLTGDGVKNKGFMLFYVDSQGRTRQVITAEDDIVLAGLRKRAEMFLENMNNEESVGGEGFDMNEE